MGLLFACCIFGEKLNQAITVETSLINRNIVLNGSFNPGEIDKYFFIKNNLISEAEFNSLMVPPSFNDFEANILTKKFRIVLNPIQLVIFSHNPNDKDDKLDEFVIKLLNGIEKPIITSFGINFDYTVDLKEEPNVQKISRDLFYKKESTFLNSFFNHDDSHFGFYASKNFHGARLKLDIKPIDQIIAPLTIIQFNGLFVKLNFHFNPADTNLIKEYNVYMEESDKIINFYQKL